MGTTDTPCVVNILTMRKVSEVTEHGWTVYTFEFVGETEDGERWQFRSEDRYNDTSGGFVAGAAYGWTRVEEAKSA